MADGNNRVAIVTGGSGGIGRAIVERLARDGFSVVVHYAGNRQRADDAVDAVAESGGRALSAGGDVADEAAMSELFDAAASEFGGVDVVVHTAGVMPLSPIADLDLDELDDVIRTNLRGTFVIAQLAARRVRNGGAVVAFSSTQTRLNGPTYGAYNASKGAVEALVRVLAKELEGKDVTVNAVAPGPVDTPLFTSGKSDELIQRIANMNPMHRLGEPADIAEIIAGLAGPIRWINGQTLFVNGGMA